VEGVDEKASGKGKHDSLKITSFEIKSLPLGERHMYPLLEGE
jgi:hypothetical protein